MLLDASGHPMGFRGGTRTLLQMTRNVGGEMLTLGDRVTLRNLEIADLADRSGNVIRVFSRRPSRPRDRHDQRRSRREPESAGRRR